MFNLKRSEARLYHFFCFLPLFPLYGITIQVIESIISHKQKRLFFAPWRVAARLLLYILHKLRPADPLSVSHLFRIRHRFFVHKTRKNRANFVFHNTFFLKTVTVVRQDLNEFDALQSQLERQAPKSRIARGLSGQRVSTATVRPDAWPRDFRERSLLKQKLAFFVEQEHRKL